MGELYKKYKYVIWIIILVLISGIFAVNTYQNSMAVLFLDFQEFDLPDELEECVTDGVLSIREEQYEKGEIVLSSPLLWLKKGSYVIGISYKTTGENNYCQLYSDRTMDEQGNIGVVFDSQPLEKGEGRIYFRPTFEQDVSNLEVRFFCEGGDLELTEVALRNTQKMTDPLWLYGFGLLAMFITVGVILCHKRTSRYLEVLVLAIAFWVLIFLTMAPFLNDYLIIGHDSQFHLARINGISTGIRNGDFMTRINPVQSYGYGYASAAMYPQLFLYPAALLNLAGMSLMNSYKCLLFFIQIVTIGSSYFSFRNIFNSKKAGIMGTFLYVLSMYRLSNIYVRGALGEVLAMIFFPLVFYSMYEIICRDWRKWYWAAVAFSGILLSHILSMELVVIVTAVFCLVYARRFFKEFQRIVALCKAALLSVLLCLWQIVPLFTYAREKLSVFGEPDIYLPDRLVRASGAFTVFSAYGYQSIGLILILGALLYIVVALSIKQKGTMTDNTICCLKIGKAGLITAMITLAMTLWVFPWDYLCRVMLIDRLIKSIQFPWRLMAVTSFMLCIVFVSAMMLIYENRNDYAYFLTLLVCVSSVINSLYYIETASGLDAFEAKAYTENMISTDYLYFYGTQWAGPFRERGNVITANRDGVWKITGYEKRGTTLKAELSAHAVHTNSWMEVPLYYYPGYHACLDGMETDLEQGTDGVIRVILPDEFNEGQLSVWFEDFWTWKIADWISWLTVFTCAGYLIYFCMRKKRKTIHPFRVGEERDEEI